MEVRYENYIRNKDCYDGYKIDFQAKRIKLSIFDGNILMGGYIELKGILMQQNWGIEKDEVGFFQFGETCALIVPMDWKDETNSIMGSFQWYSGQEFSTNAMRGSM